MGPRSSSPPHPRSNGGLGRDRGADPTSAADRWACSPIRLAGFTLIVLDEAVLTEKLLPELERRHFPESEDPAIAVRITRQDRAGRSCLSLVRRRGADPPRGFRGPPGAALRRGERGRPACDASPALGRRRASLAGRAPRPSASDGLRVSVPYYGVRMSRGRGRDGRTGLWTLDVAHRGGSVDALVAGRSRPQPARGLHRSPPPRHHHRRSWPSRRDAPSAWPRARWSSWPRCPTSCARRSPSSARPGRTWPTVSSRVARALRATAPWCATRDAGWPDWWSRCWTSRAPTRATGRTSRSRST